MALNRHIVEVQGMGGSSVDPSRIRHTSKAVPEIEPGLLAARRQRLFQNSRGLFDAAGDQYAGTIHNTCKGELAGMRRYHSRFAFRDESAQLGRYLRLAQIPPDLV